MFLASYSTGSIYVYSKEHPACLSEPAYTVIKKGKGFRIECCKSKTPCNPMFRWVVGRGSINDMIFSPDCKHIATVGSDGYLRVFDYEKQELIGVMRSYFGGLLTAAWSPDGKYIVTGGEDDHVTLWSFLEQRVIARGEGHRSWVNVVTFDPYTTSVGGGRIDDSDEEDIVKDGLKHRTIRDHSLDNAKQALSYRFGSVGDDTQLLLWDLSDDILRPQRIRTRSTRNSTMNQAHWTYAKNSISWHQNDSQQTHDHKRTYSESKLSHKSSSHDHKISFKKHSSNPSSSKHHNSVSSYSPLFDEEELSFGTPMCPRLEDVPVLEPLVAKKISQDRLCGLAFREDCLVTSTFDGYIHVWARPESTVSFLYFLFPEVCFEFARSTQ